MNHVLSIGLPARFCRSGRRSVRLLVGAGLVMSLLWPSPTRAASLEVNAPAPQSPEPRNHLVRLDGGVFSPVGFVGVSYTYSPVRWLLLEAGLGVGMTGAQLSGMPKLAMMMAQDRFFIGVGPSVSLDRQAKTAYWLNPEVGYEHSFRNGFSITLGLGATYAFAGSQTYEVSSIWGKRTPRSIVGVAAPAARMGFGYWL